MEDFIGLLADGAMGAVYVTHNLEEAVRLADRIVVLSRRPGRVCEVVTIPMTRHERRPYVLPRLRRLALDAQARVARTGRVEPHARRTSHGGL
jgi:ABC-type nitrate/sulfonate/bicarbonate transport system ATPase subunit